MQMIETPPLPRIGGVFLRVGAAAAAFAALQPIALLVFGEANPSSLSALAADTAIARRSFIVLLTFMPAIFTAYWIATLERRAAQPTLMAFASLAFALWFVLELLPRSFDLWVVLGRWLPAYVVGNSAARATLDHDYGVYRDATFALQFVRRHALLLGQLCLALAVMRAGRIGKLLALALGLSVLRLLLGTLATYGGIEALHAVADPLYFVTVTAVFPLLAVWLWTRT